MFIDSVGRKFATVDVSFPRGERFPYEIYEWARDNCPSYEGYSTSVNWKDNTSLTKFIIKDPEDQAMFKIAWGEYLA